MVLTIVIAEGPQYHVRKLTITGYQNTTEQRIRVLLKMKEGSVYSPKQLRDDAKAVADAYGSGGYVDLVVQPEGAPAGPALIDVHYNIEEGVRSFVNRVNIEGNTRTKDKVIRREVLVAPGDVFNTVRVDITKKRLENLGYFAKVETYPEETDIPGRKDLTILVQEKRTGSLSFGGGYSTIDALVGFAELSQGNFDLFNWPSFTGGGQKFRLRIQYGTQRKDFILSLTEPYFLDRRLSLNGQVFYTEANYLSSEYRSAQLRVCHRNCASRSIRIHTRRWGTNCRTSTFLMSPLAHLTSSNRRRVRLPRARFSAASCTTRAITHCSRDGDNASPFRLILPAAFLEATLRSTDWTSKDRNISTFHGTPSC